MKRILVVDDDREMVRTLCDVLRLHGWDAQGRLSGEEGVDAVSHSVFDAVLMDIKMTGMNGVDALRAMKKTRPDVCVVLMTAYASAELLSQAVDEGALQVLSKPVPLRQLTARLEEVLCQGRPVLIVDDDRESQREIASLLRAKGYEALRAGSLEEALVLLESSHPVAAVLDLPLEHLEPRDVVVAIKRLSPAVTLILSSGTPRLLEEATTELPAGFVHATLEKPFAPEQLLELLDDVARV
jgi:DNA-binding NtrC family response regulator